MLMISSDYHLTGREGDRNVALSRIESFAEKNKPEAFFMCGDTFDSRTPPVQARILAASHYKRMAGICPVFVLTGNHDAGPRSNNLEPFKILAAKNIHIITSPARIESQERDYIFLPWVFEGEKNSTNRLQKIGTMLEALRGERDVQKILFAHATPFGARLGKLDVIVTGDISIRQSTWREFGFSFFGHIHKTQLLPDNGVVVGSIVRSNFGEKEQDKGFYTLEDDKIEFHSLNPRQMEELEGTPQIVMEKLESLPESADVKVVFHLDDGESPPVIAKKFHDLVTLVKRKRQTERKEVDITGFDFWKIVEEYRKEKGYDKKVIEYARSL